WAASSQKSHRTALKNFNAWSDSNNIAIDARSPTSDTTPRRYAASSCAKPDSASLPQKFASIKTFHLTNGFDRNVSTRLRAILDGVKKEVPTDSFRDKRLPTTLGRMESLAQGLDPASGPDACISMTGFWGQLRLGELLPDF
ncbi:hypothetical protein CYLTODRAFT_314444, partial [Cylindrobasidium torrendii FP15055 ss-10]